MKFNNVLNNFTAGQWSTKMLANTESEEYKRACKELTNMLVMKQGGAFRRPGLKYFDPGATYRGYLQTATKLKIIPIKNRYGSFILVITDTPSMTDWFVTDATTGNSANITTFGSGLGTTYENPDTYQYAQVGDYVYIATGSKPIVALVTAYNNSSIYLYNNFSLLYDTYPYGPVYSLGRGPTATITSSGTAGAVTLTASTAYFSKSGTRDRYIKFTSGGVTGVALCGDPGVPGSSLTTPATIVVTLPSVGPYGTASGTSYELSERFWPTSVTSFEQRLYWGELDRVYASEQGDVYKMMEIPLANAPEFSSYASDNSRPFTIVPFVSSGSTVNTLASSKALFIGMDVVELTARGIQGSLGPNDIALETSSEYGTARIMPQRVDNFMAYVPRSKRTIRDIVYTYENEQFKTVDIGFMFDEILKESPMKRLVHGIINDTPLLFVLRENGSVVVCTLDRNSGIYAWSKLIFGGTSVVVRDIVCVPDADADGSDEIFFAIRRTINGSTVTYLEKLSNIFEGTTYSSTNMFYYMDSWREVITPGSATISAPHLAGETVHVFADGNYWGTKAITAGGNLVLDATYSRVIFGLEYTHKLIPAPLVINSQLGNSMGKVKAISTLYLKLWNTVTLTYGDPEKSLYYDVLTRPSNLVAETLIPLFTGDKRVQFPPGFSREKQLEIKGSLPFPCNILAVAVEGTNYD